MTPRKLSAALTEDGADIVGINCSGGPAQILRILKIMRQAVPAARFSVMPNAGWPEQVGGRIMYPAAADYFGDYVDAFRQNGAVILGGCCGTTPRHIAALRQAVDRCPELLAWSIDVIPAEDECEDCQPASEETSQLQRKLKEGQIRGGGRDGPTARTGYPKADCRSQPDEGSRRGCDRRGRQPDGAHAHEPVGGLPLDRRTGRHRDSFTLPDPRAQPAARAGGPAGSACAGIRNVFVVMGDPTAIGDYPDAMDDYDLLPSGLIRLIKEGFNAGVDHSGATLGPGDQFPCRRGIEPRSRQTLRVRSGV